MKIEQVTQYRAEDGHTYETVEEALSANSWSRFLQILKTKVDGFKGVFKHDLQYLVVKGQFDQIREAFQEFEKEERNEN